MYDMNLGSVIQGHPGQGCSGFLLGSNSSSQVTHQTNACLGHQLHCRTCSHGYSTAYNAAHLILFADFQGWPGG